MDRVSVDSSAGSAERDPAMDLAKDAAVVYDHKLGLGVLDEAEVDVDAVLEQARRREEQVLRDKEATEAHAARRQADDKADVEEDRRAWAEEQAWLRTIDRPKPWHRRLLHRLLRSGGEPEAPPRRFLFACDLGDPISCVQLGPGGACMAGSVQGRIWILAGQDGGPIVPSVPPPGIKNPPPPSRADLLAGWSDEGVRGLFLDDDCGYATFMESCKGWRRARPHAQTGNVRFRDLERKNTQVVKHVLQRGSWVCVLFPLSTTLVNVARRELVQRQFKLFDFGSSTDVAPCDFDGEHLLIVDRSRVGSSPVFHVVNLASNANTELDDIPDSAWITLVRLWGPDCLVSAVGRTLHVYDFKRKSMRLSLRGHWSEIQAIDSRSSETIASMATDGAIKLWSGSSGACLRTVCVPGANFFLAYPYCLCMQENRIAFSCDEGVYMIELEPQSDVV